MKMSEEKYDIYLNGRKIYDKLEEEEFNNTWKMIQNFLSITESPVCREDLTYKKIAD
jgi:hypothetical protein